MNVALRIQLLAGEAMRRIGQTFRSGNLSPWIVLGELDLIATLVGDDIDAAEMIVVVGKEKGTRTFFLQATSFLGLPRG